MARQKQFGKRKKRANEFAGTKQKTIETDTEMLDASASKRKLLCSDSHLKNDNENYSNDEGSVNVIIDLNILRTILNAVANCKQCNSTNCFDVVEEKISRKGLATSIVYICTSCDNASGGMTSLISQTGYDINTRFVYAMRCIGKGERPAQTFCAMMNLPPPPAKFTRINKSIAVALSSSCSKSMMKAADDVVSRNDDIRDISIVLDGTWQRRGHTSLNGVITAIALDNGKVLDFECLSKYCFVCKNKKKDCSNCQKNYKGYSGGMESEGATRIFERSVTTRNVRYTKYLGDGDSKGFMTISELNVYGQDVKVEKLECVGHVQKRMGSRLRNLKKNLKFTKLSDGKKISGRGRLTDTEILLIQKYYGLAIRRNALKSVKEMSKAIWAIYFHKLSTDDNPQHGLCPKGANSWCGYNKNLIAGKKYVHKHALPEAVLLAMKKIFRDLTNKDLLSKCLHGQTQNPNESFNNVVWERVPKNTFVGLQTLKIGVMDAVMCFNDGVSSRVEVLKNLGIIPGRNTCVALKTLDEIRLKEADLMHQKASKEARTTKRQKKRYSELQEISKQDEYGSGKF